MLKVHRMDERETRYFELQFNKMLLDRDEHYVATFYDVTESKRL